MSDYADFAVGRIVLVDRGACTFATKAQNAYAAGASAVVIVNDVAGDLNGTLGEGFALDIPVTSVTRAVGAELAAVPGLSLRVRTSTFRGPATTYTVLAETRTGNDGNVVMAGAHLDSVNAGPGINDNGSGSAALLEVAEQLARVDPVNTVRFAWWGAEESGPVGSTRYLNKLTDEQRSRIALYLDFDVVGSPNPGYFVHDGDDSDGDRRRRGPERLGAHREDLRGLLRPAAACRSRAPTSAAAPTTGRSSPPASRPAGCPPGPRASRPRRRPPCGVAPRGRPTTPATTGRATPSPTSTCAPSTSTATRWGSASCSTR